MAEGIYRLGVNIEPGKLFEGIWKIPDGTSINSYVVKGDKTALIDLTQDMDDFPGTLTAQMADAGVSAENIDYIIVNHMEPDHSGWLMDFRKKNPSMEIFCTKKAVPLVREFCGIEENVHAIADGELLDLGKGKVLQFFETPNIHWPETMMTYEQSEKILFSCDAFGSYGRVDDAVFDDQLSDDEHDFFEKEALRYYANIVASFSVFVERGLKKTGGPGHQDDCPFPWYHLAGESFGHRKAVCPLCLVPQGTGLRRDNCHLGEHVREYPAARYRSYQGDPERKGSGASVPCSRRRYRIYPGGCLEVCRDCTGNAYL